MMININGAAEAQFIRDLEAYERMHSSANKSPQNTSGIRVVEYNVLVKPKDVEAKTKGGLLLPDDAIEKEEFGRMEGILVDVSPMAFKNSDWPADLDGLKPQVGDRVLFSKYGATEVMGRDGGKYWLMKDTSIAGVMSDE